MLYQVNYALGNQCMNRHFEATGEREALEMCKKEIRERFTVLFENQDLILTADKAPIGTKKTSMLTKVL